MDAAPQSTVTIAPSQPDSAPAPSDVPAAPAARPEGPKGDRLLSLDAFRGVTIAGMLLVNNPGSWSTVYPPLLHAEWHGWTVTDLIFPFFLFIVGVSMTLSFGARATAGADRDALMRKATVRAAKLFGLGLLLHAFPYFELGTLRIPGVLQRIGLAYFAASAIVLYLRPRGQAAAVAVLLFGYWALLTLVPVPGGAAGVLEPGRDLGAYIDRLVFTENHLWQAAKTWDPEGLLSTLPAVGTVLLGVFAGRWLKAGRDHANTLVGLFLAGNAGILAGVIWGAAFPINKPLWTSSYVLFTAGMACHFLAVCYWIIDVKGYRRPAMPFVMFGVNAIAAFFLSGIFARLLTIVKVPAAAGEVTLKAWIYNGLFTPVFPTPPAASLAFALTFVLLWLGIMTVLYRLRIFIKV
jgi:predicted acyltransferase